jgi:hypothetical protein
VCARARTRAGAQAFADLQMKMLTARKQVQTNDAQIEYGTAVMKKVDVTRTELEQLPANTATYQSVGRMYVQHGAGMFIGGGRAGSFNVHSTTPYAYWPTAKNNAKK